jgi:hypothetical protein
VMRDVSNRDMPATCPRHGRDVDVLRDTGVARMLGCVVERWC